MKDLNFDNFGPLIDTLWFLQDHMRGSSKRRVCILYQLGLWMGVGTGWVFRRVEVTRFVVT